MFRKEYLLVVMLLYLAIVGAPHHIYVLPLSLFIRRSYYYLRNQIYILNFDQIYKR